MKAEAERHPKKGSSALCPLLTVVLVGTCFHLDHLGNSTGSLSKSQVPGHYGTIHMQCSTACNMCSGKLQKVKAKPTPTLCIDAESDAQKIKAIRQANRKVQQ